MPGAAGVLAEAGMFSSMQQREVVKDLEERVVVWFSRNKVVMDVREFSMSPEVLGKMERGVFVLGHRQGGRWERGESMTRLICTSCLGFKCLNSLIASSANTSSLETHWLSKSGYPFHLTKY